MNKLVSSLQGAIDGIKRLNESVDSHPELAGRLGQAHAYYVLEHGGKPMFGFSKFVGYEDMTPERYLRDYEILDGRNTEHALKTWFEEVHPGSSAYADLRASLTDWLSEYGKRPRGGKSQQVRLMVIRPEFQRNEGEATVDRKLLNLLIAVADMLPTSQRHELRAAL